MTDHDPVKKPAHYNHGKYEVIDVIEDWGLNDDYYLGNVIKYVARCRYKGEHLQDLEKAAWYLARAIKKIKDITPPVLIHLAPEALMLDED